MSRLIGFSGFGADPPQCPPLFIPAPGYTPPPGIACPEGTDPSPNCKANCCPVHFPDCRPDCSLANDPNLDPNQFLALMMAGCERDPKAALDCSKVPDASHCFCYRGPERGRDCQCLDTECRDIVSATASGASTGVPGWAIGLGAGLLLSWLAWGRKKGGGFAHQPKGTRL